MTTKYIELLGSIELSKYIQSVFQRLMLDFNQQFQTFLVDLMVNSVETNA